MSSPTNTIYGRRIARAVRCAVLLALCGLAACGYGLGSEARTVLPEVAGRPVPTLKFKSVDNPTLYPWVNAVIRTEVRDEIAARRIARWVDSGRADYELSIKVERFTFRSWLTNREDLTTLFAASMVLEGIIYKTDTNQEIWRSGKISYNQNYEQVQERVAAGELTRELARQLASKMQQTF